MTLFLPLPPSPNRVTHWSGKNRYRKRAWVQAVKQQPPSLDPPEHVTVSATFYLARVMRDEDNLTASLKWTLDTLRQRQQGECRWRQGLYPTSGYFIDDDPSHLTIASVEQVKVATKPEERLELQIDWHNQREQAA